MKTKLLLIASFFFFKTICGQITTPVIKANFGVDGDLSANFFNGLANFVNDDWFRQTKFGLGQSMIDTTGAATIVSNYITNPASRMNSFSRLMRPAYYSVLQNQLVLDAIFHRDYHGDDSTVFASGSNKNGMSPSAWSCPTSQGIPDKNEILDAFTHIRRNGPAVTDSLWMFGGISIENTNGNRYFDFELYQTDIVYNRNTNSFSGYGPNAGHTSWIFDASGHVLQAGDIIFSAEYSSSSLTLIEARIWINKSSLSLTPTSFDWGGKFDGASASATFGYASIVPKTSGNFYTGLQSPSTTWAGPFSLVRQDNSVVTDYTPGQFMEFSVNLTKLGIDPGSYGNNPCGTPFRRVLIKSRSSTSFTSELKDFIAPFSMFNYPKVEAFTALRYFCEIFPLTPLSVFNPNPNFVYIWHTTNGNIVGTNIGSTIMVDKPGTYYVTQQLNALCPAVSTDSITMFFDSACKVLDVDVFNFTVSKNGSIAHLQWQASNNQDAAYFEMEYSVNGTDFLPAGTVTATNQTGMADYELNFPLNMIAANKIYFRIKITGKDGRSKYSNITVVQNKSSMGYQAAIFPNPTRGELWLSVTGSTQETAPVYIWNASGKLISTGQVNITPGEHVISLPGLQGAADGVYLVKIQLRDEAVTQKVIKLH